MSKPFSKNAAVAVTTTALILFGFGATGACAQQTVTPAVIDACAQTLHLTPGEEFNACVASLGDSVDRVALIQAQAQAVSAARRACDASGQGAGSAGHALCLYQEMNRAVAVGDVSIAR